MDTVMGDFVGGAFERGINHMQSVYGKMTLLPHWTAFQKEFAGMVTQGAMMDAIERTVAGKASPKELFKLKNSYDEAMAGRILEQVALHGEKRESTCFKP
jgi:hypothetical protein